MQSDSLTKNLATAESIRRQFPALDQEVRGVPLVYLDSAATTQKPRSVIDAICRYYEHDNANVHRGVHALSERATQQFDAARRSLQKFVGARKEEEVIFTKGCTEAVNLVASSWSVAHLQSGDVVLASTAEHHANIVPWQIAAEKAGAKVIPIPILDDGSLSLNAFEQLLNQRVKVVALKHVCNALGTIYPVRKIADMAHSAEAIVMIDGAQAPAHLPLNFDETGADFYALSGHKMYGPTGIGALIGRLELLDKLPPYQGGGDMIRTVSFEGTKFADPPGRFEAGTPNIAGVIGWAAAIDFVEQAKSTDSLQQEARIERFARERLQAIPGVKVFGPESDKAPIISFTLDGVHPHDIGTVLDSHGIAIRAGHHCCMPLMQRLGVSATARASFGIYSSEDDANRLVAAVEAARSMFQ